MSNWSERLGKWDDESLIYRTDGGLQRGTRKPLAIALTVVLVAGWGVLYLLEQTVGVLAAGLIVFAATGAFLMFYVAWRRRRNERLTGSATKWPSQ